MRLLLGLVAVIFVLVTLSWAVHPAGVLPNGLSYGCQLEKYDPAKLPPVVRLNRGMVPCVIMFHDTDGDGDCDYVAIYLEDKEGNLYLIDVLEYKKDEPAQQDISYEGNR